MDTMAKITIFEIIQLIIGSGILIAIISGIYRLGKFSQRFETLEKGLGTISLDLKEIKEDHGNRLTAIETSLKYMEFHTFGIRRPEKTANSKHREN